MKIVRKWRPIMVIGCDRGVRRGVVSVRPDGKEWALRTAVSLHRFDSFEALAEVLRVYAIGMERRLDRLSYVESGL